MKCLVKVVVVSPRSLLQDYKLISERELREYELLESVFNGWDPRSTANALVLRINHSHNPTMISVGFLNCSETKLTDRQSLPKLHSQEVTFLGRTKRINMFECGLRLEVVKSVLPRMKRSVFLHDVTERG